MVVRVALIGAGAIGEQHARALAAIKDASLAVVVSRTREEAGRLAKAKGVAEIADSLDAVLVRKDIDAVILATPSGMHAKQAVRCMDAGKHVLIEIPLAETWQDARLVHAISLSSGVVSMVGHTSRYYPSNQYLRRLIEAGEFTLLHLEAQTHFMRRTNINAKGEPRVWTDNLLWHHAAHTIDLFRMQAGPVVQAHVMQGPLDPELGIALDMAIQLKARSGALCSLSLSFNAAGPIGSTFRHIGDSGTYTARRLGLEDANGQPVDLAGPGLPANGVEIQDRDFICAITHGTSPQTNLADCLETYRLIGDLHASLGQVAKPVRLELVG